MKPELTADALVQLVHRYYPVGLHNADPRYAATEEAHRLTRLLQANAAGSRTWKDFYQRVRKEFRDCSLWDTSVPLSDPCYGCRISQPGFVPGDPHYQSVVCLLSQLAPVYALYVSELEQMGPSERKGWFGFPPFPPSTSHARPASPSSLSRPSVTPACPMRSSSPRAGPGPANGQLQPRRGAAHRLPLHTESLVSRMAPPPEEGRGVHGRPLCQGS